MATAIPLTSTAAAYTPEGNTQFATITSTVMTDGVQYKISLRSGPVRLWIDNDTLGATTIEVTSQPDKYNRSADISVSLGDDQQNGRIFESHGWADANGDLLIRTNGSDVSIVAYLIP